MHVLSTLAVLFLCSVREVEPHDTHPRLIEVDKPFRTDEAAGPSVQNDFGLPRWRSHILAVDCHVCGVGQTAAPSRAPARMGRKTPEAPEVFVRLRVKRAWVRGWIPAGRRRTVFRPDGSERPQWETTADVPTDHEQVPPLPPPARRRPMHLPADLAEPDDVRPHQTSARRTDRDTGGGNHKIVPLRRPAFHAVVPFRCSRGARRRSGSRSAMRPSMFCVMTANDGARFSIRGVRGDPGLGVIPLMIFFPVGVPLPDHRRIFHERAHAGKLFRFQLRPDPVGPPKCRDAAFPRETPAPVKATNRAGATDSPREAGGDNGGHWPGSRGDCETLHVGARRPLNTARSG